MKVYHGTYIYDLQLEKDENFLKFAKNRVATEIGLLLLQDGALRIETHNMPKNSRAYPCKELRLIFEHVPPDSYHKQELVELVHAAMKSIEALRASKYGLFPEQSVENRLEQALKAFTKTVHNV